MWRKTHVDGASRLGVKIANFGLTLPPNRVPVQDRTLKCFFFTHLGVFRS